MKKNKKLNNYVVREYERLEMNNRNRRESQMQKAQMDMQVHMLRTAFYQNR